MFKTMQFFNRKIRLVACLLKTMQFYNPTIRLVACLFMLSMVGWPSPLEAQIHTTPHSITQQTGTGWSVPDFADHQADTLLAGYLNLVLAAHPAVEAARERFRASLTLGEQGAALPDPEVMVGYFLNPMTYDGVLSQATLGVMQMFPWPGTRADGRLYGDQRAQAERASLLQTQLELMNRVRDSWFSMVELYRRTAWLKEHHDWVEQLERLTLTRFESGYASRADLLRLEIERTSIAADIRRVQLELDGAIQGFNTLLGREDGEPVQWPEGRPEPEFNGSDWSENPRLMRSLALIEASETSVRQARRMGMPMIGVGAEIMGPNYVMSMPGNRVPVVAQFNVRVPVWRKAADARVAQASALERASRHEYDQVGRLLQEDFTRAMAQYRSILEEIQLLREELLPRSRELTDLLMLDFAGGRVRLDEVIAARRSTVDLSLRLEQAVRDRNLAVSRLQLIAPDGQEGVYE
jgi:outer membrane protein TolC